MPKFRSDLDMVVPYAPGRSIDEVAAELGLTEVAKLASNECPFPPWPEVIAAAAAAAADANRYPDNDMHALRRATAATMGVAEDQLLFGAGSSDLLRSIGIGMGGPGTSTVFATPSFILYRIITHLAGSTPIEVPLTRDWVHDPERLVDAVREDTTLLYVCNPNNPTGTHLSAGAVEWIVGNVPERVLVVVDEAYLHYVEATDFRSAVPLAIDRDHVVVTHTFSKVYGLAGMRVGYAVGQPETLRQIRKAQTPFPVTGAAQAAATEAISHDEQLAERIEYNRTERNRMATALASLGIAHADSQTNFIFHQLGADPADFLRHGVIIRPTIDGWARTTVGLQSENTRFLEALRTVERIT